MIGRSDRVDMANIEPQSDPELGSENIFRAMDTVYWLGAFRLRSDAKKSSHFHMKAKIAQVTRAGTISGKMIFE